MRYRVLVCLNLEARDDTQAEGAAIRLMKLSPALGRPDADWYVDAVIPDVDDVDYEAHLREMEQAAAERAVGLPFGGSR